MASLSVSEDKIAIVSSKGCFLSSHTSSEDLKVLKSSLQEPDKVDNENGKIPVYCSAFSPSGAHLAVCENKDLVVWCVNDGAAISQRPLTRSGSKIKYTPDGKTILVADKSGDVYAFDSSSKDPGQFLLGHLSLLLDLLVTPDSKYIITCDRDEKIRVSCYPNAYNIHSYCLGHREFVSSIDLLPHDVDILISSSGDGSLRLWDFKQGKQLHCHQLVPSDQQYEDVSPTIISIATKPCDSTKSLACVLPTFDKCILTFFVSSDSVHPHCKVQLKEEPLAMGVYGNTLFAISHAEDCIQKFVLVEQGSAVPSPYKGCDKLKDHLDGLLVPRKLTKFLFKKDFSEAQEYYKRKQERLSEVDSKKIKTFS